MDMSLNKLWELAMDREAWYAVQSLGSQRVGQDWAAELNCPVVMGKWEARKLHLSLKVGNEILQYWDF